MWTLLSSLGLLFSLGGCARKVPVVIDPLLSPKLANVDAKNTNDPLYTKARVFDRFLNLQLMPDEMVGLLKNCQLLPPDNPFCYAIINFYPLEEKLKAKRALPIVRSAKVKPRFFKDQIQNWNDLRVSPVSSTLPQVAALSHNQLDLLKRKALEEKGCPNLISLSIAAVLEDGLPDKSNLGEIADLFEKGAKCIPYDSVDKANFITRAGLFQFSLKNYKRAQKLFEMVTEMEEAFAARAHYWIDRCKRAQMEEGESISVPEPLKKQYPISFHTITAMTALKQDPGRILLTPDPKEMTRSQNETNLNSLIESAEILLRFGFIQSANKVLDWAVQDFDQTEPEVRIYLAELKKETGDFHAKIQILSDVSLRFPNYLSLRTMTFLFPKAYFQFFEKNTQGIDPYFLLAIARRESAFRVDAISSAKAKGLLQVLPATGRSVNSGNKQNLLDPSQNVEAGAKYVRGLIQKNGGKIHYALAAYNAGPYRLDEWLKRYTFATEDPYLFIDLIPYRETREYVAAVLRNYYWYRRIYERDYTLTINNLIDSSFVIKLP